MSHNLEERYKPKPLYDDPVPTERVCMKCRNKFASFNGARLCEKCNQSNLGNARRVGRDLVFQADGRKTNGSRN